MMLFIAGVIAGATLGVVVVSLAVMAGRSDDDADGRLREFEAAKQ